MSELAPSDRVGWGTTATVTDLELLPPEPAHSRLSVLVCISGPIISVPEIALTPDQAPEASQEFALVETQVNAAEPFELTEDGFALIETVGVCGGGVPDSP